MVVNALSDRFADRVGFESPHEKYREVCRKLKE